MKIRGFWYDSLTIIIAVVSALGFAVYSAVKGNTAFALAEITAVMIVLAIGLARSFISARRYGRMLKMASKRLDYSNSKVLSSMPYPVAVCDSDGNVAWCNELFLNEIICGEINQVYNIEKLCRNQDYYCNAYAKAGERYYSVFTLTFNKDSHRYRIFNFIDSTELKLTEELYLSSQPCVLMIETDNIDDSRSELRDSEKAEIKSRMETIIEEWCDKFNSVSKRISDDRLMIITEKKNVDAMTADKFSLLSTVRNYEFKGRNAGVTLSIGVSSGDNIRNSERNARKALEMALGRGGDQAAIRNADGSYDFIGGVSRSAEKYSKTRVRIIANKLATEISASSNVIICGHRYSDYDSLGAAAGMAFMAKSLNVPSYIAIDRINTLAGNLADRLANFGYGHMLVNDTEARELINDNTLFILVDTHMPSMCEYPLLFSMSRRYVIIDHHRLSASGVSDENHLYQNPTSSSVSEMVTEYLTYTVDDNTIPPEIAEALLAGIMLDTKNFAVRSGVRTFQAAAYLKERGANLVSVKKLFANTLEMNKNKSRVIDSAEVFKNTAISFVSPGTDNARVVAAQAADDLLNTSGVEASFVMYADGGATCISARSLGEINVQLIMEELGGGGHQTMAAVRLNNTDMKEARTILVNRLNNIPDKEIR